MRATIPASMTPTPTDPDDWPAHVLYRSAYGLAVRLAGARTEFGSHPGREAHSPAAGGPFAAVLAEVARELGRGADPDPAAGPIIRDGVVDALAGRRPRW